MCSAVWIWSNETVADFHEKIAAKFNRNDIINNSISNVFIFIEMDSIRMLLSGYGSRLKRDWFEWAPITCATHCGWSLDARAFAPFVLWKRCTLPTNRWHLCAGIKIVHTQNATPIRLRVSVFGAIWLDCRWERRFRCFMSIGECGTLVFHSESLFGLLEHIGAQLLNETRGYVDRRYLFG